MDRITLSPDTRLLALIATASPSPAEGFGEAEVKTLAERARRSLARPRKGSFALHTAREARAFLAVLDWGARNASGAEAARSRELHDGLAAWLSQRAPLPEEEVQAPLHPPSVRAKAQAVIVEAAAEMRDILLRSPWADAVPAVWMPFFRLDWSEGRKRSNADASGKRVSMAMRRHVPLSGEGPGTMHEYASIDGKPGIGGFEADDWRKVLRAVVAHEMAHCVQMLLCGREKRAGRPVPERLSNPHGEGWQEIYAHLRRAAVNGWEAEATPEAIEPRVPARKVHPPRRAEQLFLFAP